MTFKKGFKSRLHRYCMLFTNAKKHIHKQSWLAWCHRLLIIASFWPSTSRGCVQLWNFKVSEHTKNCSCPRKVAKQWPARTQNFDRCHRLSIILPFWQAQAGRACNTETSSCQWAHKELLVCSQSIEESKDPLFHSRQTGTFLPALNADMKQCKSKWNAMGTDGIMVYGLYGASTLKPHTSQDIHQQMFTWKKTCATQIRIGLGRKKLWRKRMQLKPLPKSPT